MIVITPHNDRVVPSTNIKVFIAGTIDNGNSVDWQSRVLNSLSFDNLPVTFYNPRRSNWVIDLAPSELEYQIDWELQHLETADVIFMHLEQGSISPISLLEFGLFINKPNKFILDVHDQYYRKENVIRTANRYREDMIITNDLNNGILKLKEVLEEEALWRQNNG